MSELKRNTQQSGFSLVELMVASMVLVIVFGGAFALLTKTRKVARAQNISGPHIHFETFATSKLKLYFAKLLQWTTHVATTAPAGAVAEFCKGAGKFAYAGNLGGDSEFASMNYPPTDPSRSRRTLGADMRMALSTFDFEDANGNKGLAKRHSDVNDYPWGALVPFDSRSGSTGITDVNPALSDFCGDDKSSLKSASGVDNAREMCAWVDVCSAQEGDRSANPPHPKVPDNPFILTFEGTTPAGSSDLGGQKNFRMCFAFVGNLFSRTGNFIASSGASSTGLDALDNPAVLGLAVASATFVNTNSGEDMTCDVAKHQMYRSMKVSLELFTASNVDRSLNTKKQLFFKTRQQFVSEKLGIALPNCQDPSRNSPVNLAGNATCIGDPTFFFACDTKDCANPDTAY